MITEKKTQFLVDELDQLRKDGLFRPLRVLGSAQDTEVLVDGKRVLNLSSNNYLGLTTHPRLKSAMVTATEEWGAGSGAVRTIAGTMTVHEELERRLAEFKHTEASLVFQSGFTANLGVLQSLVKEGDVIISDELNHASIIDGIRLSKAERSIFKHRDLDDLERHLEKHRDKRVKLVVTDGVFSMDGDIAPLAGIVERAERFDAWSWSTTPTPAACWARMAAVPSIISASMAGSTCRWERCRKRSASWADTSRRPDRSATS